MKKGLLAMLFVITLVLFVAGCDYGGGDFRGDIIVESNEGARVYLNNQNQGTVNSSGELLIENVEVGIYNLTVQLDGYDDIVREVEVLNNDVVRVEARFEEDANGETPPVEEEFTLSLYVLGDGTVTMNGQNIQDGQQFKFPEGTLISLEAIEEEGLVFDAWLYEADSQIGLEPEEEEWKWPCGKKCQFNLNEDMAFTARFIEQDVPPAPKTSVHWICPESASVEVGETVELELRYWEDRDTPVNCDTQGKYTLVTTQVEWSSSNNAQATITQTGVVTGVSAGNPLITATHQGATPQRQVTVQAPPTPPSDAPPTPLFIVLRDDKGMVISTSNPHQTEQISCTRTTTGNTATFCAPVYYPVGTTVAISAGRSDGLGTATWDACPGTLTNGGRTCTFKILQTTEHGVTARFTAPPQETGEFQFIVRNDVNGRRVTDAKVTLSKSGNEIITCPYVGDARYNCREVPVGSYYYGITHDDYKEAGGEITITSSHMTSNNQRTVRLTPVISTGSVTFTVHDSTNEDLINGAVVSLAGPPQRSCTTSDGVCTIRDVPILTSTFLVSASGYQIGGGTVTIIAGEEVKRNIVLKPEITLELRNYLEGTKFDVRKKSPSGTHTQLTQCLASDSYVGEGITRYKCAVKLPSNSVVNVVASKQGYETMKRDVSIGTSDLNSFFSMKANSYYMRIRLTRNNLLGLPNHQYKEFTGRLEPGKSTTHTGYYSTAAGNACAATVRVTMSDDGSRVTCRTTESWGTGCNYKALDNADRNNVAPCFITVSLGSKIPLTQGLS